MKTTYDILQNLLRTEKGTSQEPQRKYYFQVADWANKVEVRKAVEEVYKVKVQDVNVLRMPSKPKRVRQEAGHTSPWKKAVVTLKEGDKIDIT